jgi:von Willebrand factor type A domain-containing protein
MSMSSGVFTVPVRSWAALGWHILPYAILACGSRSGLDGVSRATDDVPFAEESDSSGLAEGPTSAPARPFADGALDTRSAEAIDAATGCVDITRRYASIPPTVLLLIDQSASMNERFGRSTRWDVLRRAIVDPADGLLAWLEAGANIGLMLYTSLDGHQRGLECPLVDQVDVRLDNADAIREFYAGAEPLSGGDTPTADAIDLAVASLSSLRAGPGQYVLLLTDGVPDTCAEPDPQNGFDAAVEAAQRARARGIEVVTVGVSPDIARAGLQRMANAGAGKALELVFGRDPDAAQPLYASTEPRDLAQQLEGVIADVRSCTIELGTTVDRARRGDARLVLDGVPLRYGDEDGWRFVDEDTLSVDGHACLRILGNGQALEVELPCDDRPRSGEIR